MAIFKHRLTKEEIERDYTHHAYFHGFVPIYFHEDTHATAVRNWWPEWLLDFGDLLFDIYVSLGSAFDPYFEPDFKVRLGSEIVKPQKDNNDEVD
ncbi:hypothetical protein ABZX01_003784 [Vibrio vulnificus]|jgi:hypothetical protein